MPILKIKTISTIISASTLRNKKRGKKKQAEIGNKDNMEKNEIENRKSNREKSMKSKTLI